MRFQRSSTFAYPAYHNSAQGGSIFGFFSSIFKKLLPLAKSALGLGAKAVQSTAGQNIINAASEIAADAGKKVAKDILEGKSAKSAAKEEFKAAGKKAAKAVKRSAVKAGLDIIDDTLKGQKLKASAKKRITQASEQLLTDMKTRGKKRGGKGGKKGRGGAKRGRKGIGRSGGGCGKRRGAGKKKVLKIKKNNMQQLGKQLVRQWL